MRITALPLLPVTVAVLLASPSLAQDTERYRLERTPEGFVRMDVRTGEMSVCREQGVELVCRASVDERAAFQNQIEELEERVDGLEARLAQLEGRIVINPEAILPSDEDFDRTLDQMERFFRRFMGIARGFDEQMEPRPEGDSPGRT